MKNLNTQSRYNTFLEARDIITYWKALYRRLGESPLFWSKKRLVDRINLDDDTIDGINAILWYQAYKKKIAGLLKKKATAKNTELLAVWYYYQTGVFLRAWKKNLNPNYFFHYYNRICEIQLTYRGYYLSNLNRPFNNGTLNKTPMLWFKSLFIRLFAPIASPFSSYYKKIKSNYDVIRNESENYYTVFTENDTRPCETSMLEGNDFSALDLNHNALIETCSKMNLSDTERNELMNPALSIEKKLKDYMKIKNKNSVNFRGLLEDLDFLYWGLEKALVGQSKNIIFLSKQLLARAYLRHKYIILHDALVSSAKTKNKKEYEKTKQNLEKTYSQLQAFNHNKCCKKETLRKIMNDTLTTLLEKELKAMHVCFDESYMTEFDPPEFVESRTRFEVYLKSYYSMNFTQTEKGELIANFSDNTQDKIDAYTMKFVFYKKLMDFKKNIIQHLDQFKAYANRKNTFKNRKHLIEASFNSVYKNISNEFILLKRLYSNHTEFNQIAVKLKQNFTEHLNQVKEEFLSLPEKKENETHDVNALRSNTAEESLFLTKARLATASYCLALDKLKEKLIDRMVNDENLTGKVRSLGDKLFDDKSEENEISDSSIEDFLDKLKEPVKTALEAVKTDKEIENELKNIDALYRMAIFSAHPDKNNDQSAHVKSQLSDLFNDAKNKKKQMDKLIRLEPVTSTLADNTKCKIIELVQVLLFNHYQRRGFSAYLYDLTLRINDYQLLLDQTYHIKATATLGLKLNELKQLFVESLRLMENESRSRKNRKEQTCLDKRIIALEADIEKLREEIRLLDGKIDSADSQTDRHANTIEVPQTSSFCKHGKSRSFFSQPSQEPSCTLRLTKKQFTSCLS